MIKGLARIDEQREPFVDIVVRDRHWEEVVDYSNPETGCTDVK